MQMHRTTTLLSTRGAGAEPGVDPRRDLANLVYGHIRENCVIDICDYSSVRSSSGRMGNREFVQFLNDDDASAKEPWVKVRWINVSGISWDVISALAIKYGEWFGYRISIYISLTLFFSSSYQSFTRWRWRISCTPPYKKVRKSIITPDICSSASCVIPSQKMVSSRS